MSSPLAQHQAEIERNRKAWQNKPLLREIYRGFYERIIARIDTRIPGRIVEVGSGIGNLREHFPEALATDLFPNPWLDLACDAYELPFKTGALSHLILFDVFHHLEAPVAFLNEAQRTLGARGRVIIFDPYISLASWPAYGAFHPEPISWNSTINLTPDSRRPRNYYAAQGNATRLFFGKGNWLPSGWKILHAERFAAFSYLLSGGFSKPQLYPSGILPLLRGIDSALSIVPRLFGARCLIVLSREPNYGR